MPDLFFNPSTIAVIGATSNPKKFGNAVTLNILSNNNLKSELFLISRSSEEILGHKCYKTLFDVPKEIDLAILLIPAKAVMSLIDDCIKKKVKRIIIVTSGFGEVNQEGKKIEEIITDKCNKANIRVMGPNCVGIQNTELQLNASFIQMPKKGRIGMISQSGSIGCAAFYALQNWNLGISKFANIGNAIDISFTEILDYLGRDNDTELIAIYLESINDAKGFFNKLKEITIKKPIVLLKGGKTESGLKAASSHTGSVATDYKILSTAVKQANGIICESMHDLIIAIKT
ncbi:MAG: CoA-binding protein, partial [Candidatus Hermodarchaeota archaeon]